MERSVKAIFGEAIEQPREGRSAFLDGACRGDPELRRQVDALIKAWERADDFLASPTAERVAEAAADDLERPGSRIGPYRLLQQIGEGGMGTVYMAEQDVPVRRKVALKIIKLGMDTKQVIARFEAERQALAMMDHPNIARVLDAGATDAGRPYFVMELVRGVALHEYCDSKNLSTRERLRLFIAVCNAVQHAHQKGIIHRDLKPSNVLVTLHDGIAVPKVIDFGIAKATSSRLTDKTLFTEFRSFLGTPEYMSPEQAEMSGLDIDTRSDIYALGVLLYELLTGTTPFDARALRQAAFDELQRIIREDEPEKPSTRLSTLAGDSLTSVARRHDTDAAGLSRVVRGDLDWIVMKALEKDRTRRYETASAMAEDVRRHLASEPVLASPPSLTYKLRKFVRRNRIAVVSASAVVGLLVLAILGTSWGFVRARSQQELAVQARNEAEHSRSEALRRAEEARAAREEESAQRGTAEQAGAEALAAKELAEREAVRAHAVTEFLIDTLALADPGVALAPDLTMRAVLDRAAAQVGRRFEGQPEAEAALRSTIGKAYYSLGELEVAEPHLRRALELWDRGADVDRWMLYETLWPLTSIVFALGSPEIQAFGSRVMLLSWQMLGAEHSELALALGTMVDGNMTGKNAAARSGYEEALRIARAQLPLEDPRWRLIADNLFASGYAPWYFRSDPEAERYIRDALAIYRRVLPETHPQVGMTLEMLVSILNGTGQYEEAESLVRESLDILRRMFPADHGYIGASKARLGECIAGQKRFEEAERILLEALSTGLDDAYAATEILSATVRMYDAWGRPDVAERYRTELAKTLIGRGYVPTLAVIQPAFGPQLAPLFARLERLQGFALLLKAEGADQDALFDELQTLVDDYGRLRRELVPETHPLAPLIARELMNWTGHWGTGARFEVLRGAVIDDARSILQHWERELPDAFGWSLYLLALLEVEKGDFARAELMLREALQLTIRGLGRSSSVAATMRVDLAGVLRALKRDAEAEPLLTEAYPIFVEQVGALSWEAFDCARAIERYYREQGRSEAARPFVEQQVEALKRMAEVPSIQTRYLVDYARFLLDCKPEDLRAPETAVLLARRANELTDGQRRDYVDLLARAYGESGDTASAIELLRATLEEIGPEHAWYGALETRLKQYAIEGR